MEEFETGLFSNFELMISLCLWIGLVFAVIGAVMMFLGHRNEDPKIAELESVRNKVRDDYVCSLHGWNSLDDGIVTAETEEK